MTKDKSNIPATTFGMPAYLDALRKLFRKHKTLEIIMKKDNE